MRPVKDRWTWPARTPPGVRLTPKAGRRRGQAWHTPTRVPPRGVAGLGRTGLGDQSGGGTGLLGEAGTETWCKTIILVQGNHSPQIAHSKATTLSHTPISAITARIRRPETAGRPKRIRHLSHHHLMQGFEGQRPCHKRGMLRRPGLRALKDHRSTGQNRPCDDATRFDGNQGLRVEKPLPQRIEVDHRRNRDDRAAAAADQRQHDTRIERMFGDAMGQRMTGSAKTAKRKASLPRAMDKEMARRTSDMDASMGL